MAKKKEAPVNPYEHLRGIKHGRCGSYINEHGINVPIGANTSMKNGRSYYISGLASNECDTVELRRYIDNGEIERIKTVTPKKPFWSKK